MMFVRDANSVYGRRYVYYKTLLAPSFHFPLNWNAALQSNYALTNSKEEPQLL